MQEITKTNQEKYQDMVEALNNFYWDNGILPKETAARLDVFAGDCVRLAQFIRGEIQSLPRVAEQRDAPVRAGQPCPSCNGYGTLLDTEANADALCPECEGTGWANRPAGG